VNLTITTPPGSEVSIGLIEPAQMGLTVTQVGGDVSIAGLTGSGAQMGLTVTQVGSDVSIYLTDGEQMGLTITQVGDVSRGVSGEGLPSITIAVPGSIGGPTGATGPRGPAGPPGQTFVFTQPTAATVWTITHNLGVFPAVVVADSAGTLIEGDVVYTDNNTVTLTFSAAFSGDAYLI
jgi:hypothetical protein